MQIWTDKSGQKHEMVINLNARREILAEFKIDICDLAKITDDESVKQSWQELSKLDTWLGILFICLPGIKSEDEFFGLIVDDAMQDLETAWLAELEVFFLSLNYRNQAKIVRKSVQNKAEIEREMDEVVEKALSQVGAEQSLSGASSAKSGQLKPAS